MNNKNIFVAGIFHETHTFLDQKTTLNDFIIHTSSEIINKNIGNGSPMDGFLEYAKKKDWNIIPSIQMAARPSGIVESQVTTYFKSNLFKYLEETFSRLDGIYLVLHGAMVSEDHDDFEGDLLLEISNFLKKKNVDIPIVAVLDLHANVSKKMTDFSTGLFAYRKNPHSDAKDAAIKASNLLDKLLDNPSVKQIYLSSEYILPPTGVGSTNNPMRSILRKAKEIEDNNPDILCINVMAGYSYADIADCGFSLNCCTKGSEEEAHNYLIELLAILEKYIGDAYPLERNLEDTLNEIEKLKDINGPILLIEPSDNIGGGTPGDGTSLLGQLLETDKKNILAIINDPEAAMECHNKKIGDEVSLFIGAKIDTFHGESIPINAKIEFISDGKFELENKNSHLASMMGDKINMGLSAVIKNEKVRILLTSIKTPPMDLGQLYSQKIDPKDAKLIIIKAAVSHKDAYDPIASYSFYIDSEGLCTSNLKRLPYKKIKNKKISLV